MGTAQVIENHIEGGVQPTASGDMQQFLSFTLGAEEYGVDILMVREVKGWTATTRLPNTPEYVRGVLNLRGIIIPIFDLRARFTGKLTEPNSKNVVVILTVDNRTVGILADTVSDILTAGANDIRPAPDTGNSIDQRFVSGLIAVEGRMVVLLDMKKLLSLDLEHLDARNGTQPVTV